MLQSSLSENAKSTAYCGLYCADCNRSKGRFFALLSELDRSLAELNFEKYAAYKARTNAPAFADYPVFVGVLSAIKELACVGCRDKPEDADCKIRRCVLAKGIAGCWDCSIASDCAVLAPIAKAHASLAHNHACIRDCGLERWSDKRGRHYSWDP